MKDRDEGERQSQRSDSSGKGEFSDAMSRLEKAVQDLVTVTAGELGERATSVINETSKRLEAELRLNINTGEDPEQSEQQQRRRRRHRNRHRFTDDVEGQYSTLYIDSADEKIAGVCAAFARYFGVENWVVRMGALTGLIFMPQIVFPGYWIAYFVIEKKHSTKRRRGRGRRGRRARRRERMAARMTDAGEVAEEIPQTAKANPEPQREPPRPTRDLRHVTTDLTQAELRLRRLERFVTSDSYELHRELNKIEQEGGRA